MADTLLEDYQKWKQDLGAGVAVSSVEPVAAAAGEPASTPAAASLMDDYQRWKAAQPPPPPSGEEGAPGAVPGATAAVESPPPASAAAPFNVFRPREFTPPEQPLPIPPGPSMNPFKGLRGAIDRRGEDVGRLFTIGGGLINEAVRAVSNPFAAASNLPGKTLDQLVQEQEQRSWLNRLLSESFIPIPGAGAPFGGISTGPALLAREGPSLLSQVREAIPLTRPLETANAASAGQLGDLSKRVEGFRSALETAQQSLDEATANLEASTARGKPAPKFGTPERAEFDVSRRGLIPKTEQVRRARLELQQAREKVAQAQGDFESANSQLELALQEPVTEPVAPESRLVAPTEAPTPTAGVAQPGLGIGEQPTQGALALGGQIAARESVPLIDAQQMAERQRLAAEARAGQQALPEARAVTTQAAEAVPPPPPVAPPPAAVLPPRGPLGVPPPPVAAGPSDMQRIIAQAAETVRQDRPGAVSDLVQRIPGIKQARLWERQGLAMTGENENVLVAHVSENLARADVRAQATASRVPLDEELAVAFGPKVVAGDESPVRFLGTAEQAKSPLVHTLVDMADRPELYELTTAQRQALVDMEARNTGLLRSVNRGYNANIGEYPARPGGAFLTHIDVPEDFPADPFNRGTANVARGGSKPRIYQTNAERLEADPTYKPELNVTKLLDSMDNAKIGAAAGQSFREAVGGLTKLEAMQETHPNLYNKMTALRARLQTVSDAATRLGGKQKEVIDAFLSSPLEGADLATLQADLNPTIGANAVGREGPNFGKDLKALRTEIAGVKRDIANLRPAWNSADLKPYQFVQQGIYRYFEPEQAALINDLRKRSTSGILRVMEEIRAGAFSGDLSPFLGVQTPIGVLANPIGSSKMAAGAIIKAVEDRNLLRSFSSRALAEDMARDPSWREYASLIGRAPTATPAEFSAGYMSRIPLFGPLISKFTEGTYVVVTRQSKGLWQSMSDSLIKSGVPEMEAKVAAAGISSEVYPMMSPTRLGQSPERNAIIRALPTSYSFIRQPASLITQATRGYVKLGSKQTLTPQERLAVQIVTTMAASVMSASVVSGVLSAEATGGDAAQAALDAVNPDPKNGRFASLVFGNFRVPLGGPFRALFRAIYPKEVPGMPVPVPFAGLANFAQNRLQPVIGVPLRIYKNKDFYGQPIREGTFPEQVLQSLVYTMQGVAPLTIGQTVEGLRSRTASGQEIASQAIGQFAGVNVSPTENAREIAAKYEKSNTLPPKDASLTVLRTAYYRAGEGKLSDTAKEDWRQYDILPEAERKLFRRSVSPEEAAELLAAEKYSKRRRPELARNFPDLDVLLVEEKFKAHRNYKPHTPEGRARQRELRGGAYEPYGMPLLFPNLTPEDTYYVLGR